MHDFLRRQRQLLTFLVVGGLSAAVDLGVLQLLLLQHTPVYLATSIALVAGIVFNLCCHARYTFASALDAGTVLRYLCIVGLNFALTLACVKVAVGAGVSPLLGKLVALTMVPVISFLCGKYWVFRPTRT